MTNEEGRCIGRGARRIYNNSCIVKTQISNLWKAGFKVNCN